MIVYSLDIGGSSIKHGLFQVEANNIEIISIKHSIPLPTNKFSDLKQIVFDIIQNAINETPSLKRIGISTTGSVDSKGIVISAGHFNGYTNISWDNIIKEKYNSIEKVITVNDGRASTWGEYISYNNKKRSHLHVVVGTGVGGGIVYNNELLMGDSGQAGYIGHMKITSEETIICSCGKNGCLETLASAPGIISHFNQFSNTINEADYKAIINLAKKGNNHAIEAILKGGYWLGIGIGNSMNILNPTVVTIGGGVISSTNELKNTNYFNSVIEGAKYASHRRVFSSCDIRKSIHGNNGGLIGASSLTIR